MTGLFKLGVNWPTPGLSMAKSAHNLNCLLVLFCGTLACMLRRNCSNLLLSCIHRLGLYNVHTFVLEAKASPTYGVLLRSSRALFIAEIQHNYRNSFQKCVSF